MANRSARTAASCSSDVSAGRVASLRISERCCSSSSLIRHSIRPPNKARVRNLIHDSLDSWLDSMPVGAQSTFFESTTSIGRLLYRIDPPWFDALPGVPGHTEARIQKLITEALAATSDTDIEHILPELRDALQEHIRLAKESLEAQAVALERPLPEMS